jgi:hypothetical protein
MTELRWFVVLLAVAAEGCSSKSSGGTGTDGGTNPNCTAFCPSVTAAGCTNGPPSQAECLSVCNSVASACPTEFSALAACSTGKTFTCNAQGSAVAPGCAAQYTALETCITNAPPPSSSGCASICPAVVAAGCASGPPNNADCVTGCNAQVAACSTQMAAMIACAQGKAFTCDATGSPIVASCASQFAALNSCGSTTPPVTNASCASICAAVVAAGCSAGAPTLADCVTGCTDTLTACPTQMNAFLACAQGKSFTCDATGSPVVAACAAQEALVNACLP